MYLKQNLIDNLEQREIGEGYKRNVKVVLHCKSQEEH